MSMDGALEGLCMDIRGTNRALHIEVKKISLFAALLDFLPLPAHPCRRAP